MSEVHRYKVVKMLSEVGNQISYDPHGPDVVVASAYDQLKAESETLRAELAWSESDSREQSAELTKLRSELAGLRTGFDAQNEVIAGLKKAVERYQWLRKSTPYRFKKMQEASTTDGGDVFYFHADRFDSLVDADMGKGGEA